MAPKRPAPAEQPPPAESSDEEESSSESIRSEEEQVEEESSDSEEPKATQPKAPQPKPSSSAPPPPANSKPEMSSPSSESESESGSDSESESDTDEPTGEPRKTSEPTAPANAKPRKSAPETDSDSDVTPLAAKAMEGQSTPLSKKPNLKRQRRELTAAAKDAAKTSSKKSSNATPRGSQITGEESSKRWQFQRVWSEEDEVTILEGMIEYWEKRGIDPLANTIGFREFIKERLHLDAVPSQLASKIRSLKKRFKNNEAKGKSERDRPYARPNLQRAFELSKKLWDSEHGIIRDTSIPKANANGSSSKKKKSSENTSSAIVIPPLPRSQVKDEGDNAIMKAETWNSDANPMSLCESEMIRFTNGRVDHKFLRRGLSLISDTKREELEERWKEVNLAKLQVLSEQALMIHEQINLVIDAFEKR